MNIKDIFNKDLVTGEETRSLRFTPLQRAVVSRDMLASAFITNEAKLLATPRLWRVN